MLDGVFQGHDPAGGADSDLGDLRRRSGAYSGNREQVFSGSLRIRCWFHKLSNIRSKIPGRSQAAQEFMAHLRSLRDAPTHQAGEAAASSLIEQFSETYPAAVRCFGEDLDASLAHLKLPVASLAPDQRPHDQPP